MSIGKRETLKGRYKLWLHEQVMRRSSPNNSALFRPCLRAGFRLLLHKPGAM